MSAQFAALCSDRAAAMRTTLVIVLRGFLNEGLTGPCAPARPNGEGSQGPPGEALAINECSAPAP